MLRASSRPCASRAITSAFWYGFSIVGMWEASAEQRTEFVYLLEWPDQAVLAAAWAAFRADEEWQAIKRATSAEHGDLVGAIEDRVLAPIG